MNFFKKVETSSNEKKGNSSLSNASPENQRPLEEETGNINEGFEMIDKNETGDSVLEGCKETINQEDDSRPNRPYINSDDLIVKFILCLDHPNLKHWVTIILLGLTFFGIVYSIAGSGFALGSQLFSLISLFVLAYIGGVLIQFVKLPPLLGMLLVGVLLRNVGFIHLEGVYIDVATVLREMALTIILIRAGLGLDPKALKSLRVVILRVACIPGVVEAFITTVVTHFLFGLPWLWGILSGAVLAAVSPAVVIPCLFSLKEKGYGTGKGIPTLVVAAASLDDIMAITAFGVVLNLIYSTDTSVTMQIVQGPLGIFIGVIFGIIWGYVSRFFPHQNDGQVVLLRVLMIIGGGLVAIIGSQAIGYEGAGPLGCIIATFVACLGWKKQNYSDEYNPVDTVFRVIWLIFQPILFGLIGSEVDVSVLEISIIGNSLITLFTSLLGRIVVTVFIAYRAGLNWKEKTFIAWAWLPKATVQAALAPLALDVARRKGSEEDVAHAGKILVLAVFAILITAPAGAALITTLGPKLLTKGAANPRETERANIGEVSLESRNEYNKCVLGFTPFSASILFGFSLVAFLIKHPELYPCWLRRVNLKVMFLYELFASLIFIEIGFCLWNSMETFLFYRVPAFLEEHCTPMGDFYIRAVESDVGVSVISNMLALMMLMFTLHITRVCNFSLLFRSNGVHKFFADAGLTSKVCRHHRQFRKFDKNSDSCDSSTPFACPLPMGDCCPSIRSCVAPKASYKSGPKTLRSGKKFY